MKRPLIPDDPAPVENKRAKRVRLDLGGASEVTDMASPYGIGVEHGRSGTRFPTPSQTQTTAITVPIDSSAHSQVPSQIPQPMTIALPMGVEAKDPAPNADLPSTTDTGMYFDANPALILDYGNDSQNRLHSNSNATWDSCTQPNLASEVTHSTPEPSSGTLVMNKYGGSKYFGHTAASEWLKDVRPIARP